MSSYKSDSAFFDFLKMGVAAVQRVMTDLREQHQQPIVLERGSLNYKVWKFHKSKRRRIPDILCLGSGARVECRGKRRFELSMSHSLHDIDRAWDSGLRDSDYVAFVGCQPIDGRRSWTTNGPVQYTNVGEMRQNYATGRVRVVQSKGREAGFETRVVWPCSISKCDGQVQSVTPEKVVIRNIDGNTRSIFSTQRFQNPLKNLEPGSVVEKNQVVASDLRIHRILPYKTFELTSILELISSPGFVDRYTGVKALSVLFDSEAKGVLLAKVEDSREEDIIRLEAASSLALHGVEKGFTYIASCIRNTHPTLRLEATLVAAEVPSPITLQLLVNTLYDRSLPSGLRSAAAWGLGEMRNQEAVSSLVRVFEDFDKEVRVEAALALSKLASSDHHEVLQEFARSTKNNVDGLAYALSRTGKVSPKALGGILQNGIPRTWLPYVLAKNFEVNSEAIAQMEELDPPVHFATCVLAALFGSWIQDIPSEFDQ